MSPNSTGTLPPQVVQPVNSPNNGPGLDLYGGQDFNPDDFYQDLLDNIAPTEKPREDPPSCTEANSCKSILSPMNFLKKDEIEEAYFEDSLANVLFKNRTFSRYGLDIGCCTDRFCSVKERVLSYAPCYGFGSRRKIFEG